MLRIGELWKRPRFLVPAYGLSALVMQAGGQVEEANAMIHRAESHARFVFTPYDLGTLALHQIGLWIAQNDFQAITHWEQGNDLEWRSQTGRGEIAYNCPRRARSRVIISSAMILL